VALLDELAVVLGTLGRDRDQRGAELDDLRQGRLQSYQLCVAVRSPPSAIERDHEGAAGQQRARRNWLAIGAGQREVGHPAPWLQDPGGGAGRAQLVDGAVHLGDHIRRTLGFETDLQGCELGFE
jgi:hypothetical protein